MMGDLGIEQKGRKMSETTPAEANRLAHSKRLEALYEKALADGNAETGRRIAWEIYELNKPVAKKWYWG